MIKIKNLLVVILSCSIFLACNSDSVDRVSDAVDLIDGVPRKDIDKSQLGLNAFFNDGRFGSISSQYSEIQNTLKINRMRVLFAWNDAIQSGPSAQPNFSFYDQIVNSAPPGAELLVVLTGIPDWMGNSANWIDGDPRKTFVEKWVKPVVRRYGSNPSIVGWQIWNEPNMPNRFDNNTLGLTESPGNFLNLVALSYSACKEIASRKLVLNGATTSINQNFPDTLNYNRALRDGGLSGVTDVFAMHYYGRQFENVIQPDGVQDFLQSIGQPIWITESGAQGAQQQLAYGEQVWPFLNDKIDQIQRIYIYQMYEATDPSVTYGLRNLSGDQSVSDLYVFLRDG